MGAEVKEIYQCPRCEEGITGKKPRHCPGCGYEFASTDGHYRAPYTFFEQLEKLQNKEAHRQAILDVPIEKANSMLNDALNIIQTIPGKKIPQPDIRQLVRMAIQIGRVAQAYEDFLASGGIHASGFYAEKSLSSPGESDEPLPKSPRPDVT